MCLKKTREKAQKMRSSNGWSPMGQTEFYLGRDGKLSEASEQRQDMT